MGEHDCVRKRQPINYDTRNIWNSHIPVPNVLRITDSDANFRAADPAAAAAAAKLYSTVAVQYFDKITEFNPKIEGELQTAKNNVVPVLLALKA